MILCLAPGHKRLLSTLAPISNGGWGTDWDADVKSNLRSVWDYDFGIAKDAGDDRREDWAS